LMILVIILSGITKTVKNNRRIDIIIFSVFSILAVLMIFFNFFTDHAQMRLNLNILWLNPIIIVCLFHLIVNKHGQIWYRIVFFISASFLILHFFLPQEFNLAFLPLAVIILVRSSVRSGFDWNPFSINHL
jgi:cell shape-determining protein MreD